MTTHNRIPAARGGVRVRVVEFVCLQPGDVILGPDGVRHPVKAVEVVYPFGYFTTTTGITVSYNDWYLLRTATYDVLDQDDQLDHQLDELDDRDGEDDAQQDTGDGPGGVR
jgi:hypothetical protein